MDRQIAMDMMKEGGVLTADGFDDCIVGVQSQCNEPPRAVYSAQSVITKLMDRDGMTDEEAREFYDFNISGAYVGEKGPIFMEEVD